MVAVSQRAYPVVGYINVWAPRGSTRVRFYSDLHPDREEALDAVRRNMQPGYFCAYRIRINFKLEARVKSRAIMRWKMEKGI